jgi:hypothetical protein
MVAVPGAIAVTLPELSTVATRTLLLHQCLLVLVALAGLIVADKVSVPPINNVAEVLFNVTPVTGTTTLTTQAAILPPSAVVTRIIASPGAMAVTLPLPSTIATFVLLLLQVTVLFVALEGIMFAVKVSALPTASVLILSRVTPVTGILTVMAQEATLLPSAVVTVIFAVPAPTAVTLPPLSTVATALLLLRQVTTVFVALSGMIAAVKVSV